MSSGLVPVNQFNALPALTIAEAVAATRMNVLGGSVTKYWDETAMGVNGLPPQSMPVTVGNYWFLASNWLDMRGCKYFALMFQRLALTNDASAPVQWVNPYALAAQYRSGPTDVPPIITDFAGTIDQGASGYLAMGPVAGFNKFRAGDYNQKQRYILTFGAATNSTGGSYPESVIGSDVRIIVNWGALGGGLVPGPAKDTSTFTFRLWGSS